MTTAEVVSKRSREIETFTEPSLFWTKRLLRDLNNEGPYGKVGAKESLFLQSGKLGN